MTEIYLIRHIQAEGNLYRMMQGHWNGGVTPLGLKQAKALGERFREVKLDGVYSSDLYRALVTASGVIKYHPELEVQKSKAFRELNVGGLERKFFGDILHQESENMKLFMYDSEKWTYDGAETFLEAGARGLEELKKVADLNPGKCVAVVSHGVTIRSMLSIITETPLSNTEKLPICYNASITKLRYSEGKFSIEYFNDTDHLGSLPRWSSTLPSLRAERLELPRDAAWYCKCYEDSWQNAHGNLRGYREETYLLSAAEHIKRDPESVLKLYDGETPAGIVEMDTQRCAEEGKGWVAFLYLTEEYRGKGLGIQLLARAIMHYSDLGRKALCLTVAESNTRAMAFYKKYGFTELNGRKTATGTLFTMERSLENKSEEI